MIDEISQSLHKYYPLALIIYLAADNYVRTYGQQNVYSEEWCGHKEKMKSFELLNRFSPMETRKNCIEKLFLY